MLKFQHFSAHIANSFLYPLFSICQMVDDCFDQLLSFCQVILAGDTPSFSLQEIYIWYNFSEWRIFYGALFSGGLLLAFSLLIGQVLTVIGMFFGHIILFDSIFFAVLSGIAANTLMHLHPVLSLLAGIAVLLFLFWVQYTRFGF